MWVTCVGSATCQLLDQLTLGTIQYWVCHQTHSNHTFLIILMFKAVSYLPQYPSILKRTWLRQGVLVEGKGGRTRVALQQTSRVDADRLLNLDCEVSHLF